jgi:hypothetical protein
MPTSYLPAKLVQFSAFALNFSTLISATPSKYGFVAGDAAALATAYSTFAAAYTTSQNAGTRTSPAVAATQQARNALSVIIRNMARLVQSNMGVADADRQALGLPIRDSKPTVTPPPATFPILGVVGGTPRQLTVTYRDQNSTPKSRMKPAGVTALEVHVLAAATAPASAEATPFFGDVTRTPFALDFEEADVGKTAFIYARWKNRKGQTGPWSALSQFVIPG